MNIPLNDQLMTAGDVATIGDLGAVRARFEVRWNAWNIVRAFTSAGAFGCLSAATLLR